MFNVNIREYFSILNVFIVCICNTVVFKSIPLLCTHVYSYMFSTVHPQGWGPMGSPSPIQHLDLSFEYNQFIFVSSLKMTCFQSSKVQSSYLWANPKCGRTYLRLIIGFLCCTCAPNLASLKAQLTMMSDNNLHVSNQSCFVVTDAVPNLLLVIRVTQWLFCQYARNLDAILFVSQSRPLHYSPYTLQKIGSCPLKRQICE